MDIIRVWETVLLDELQGRGKRMKEDSRIKKTTLYQWRCSLTGWCCLVYSFLWLLPRVFTCLSLPPVCADRSKKTICPRVLITMKGVYVLIHVTSYGEWASTHQFLLPLSLSLTHSISAYSGKKISMWNHTVPRHCSFKYPVQWLATLCH